MTITTNFTPFGIEHATKPSQVHLQQSTSTISPARNVDQVTLSETAINLAANPVQEDVNDKNNTASSLDSYIEAGLSLKKNQNSRFSEVLQSIIDARLGVDRDKLDKIEAKIQEIKEDDNLSAEDKQKALEELEKLKEEIVQQGRDIQAQAERTLQAE